MDSFLEFPFYGQICVLVNKGYKIFDLRRGVVIKTFRKDVDSVAIKNEMDQIKIGSQFNFGLSIRKMNIKEGWYEEDYISGSLDNSPVPRITSVIIDKFQREIIPCLNKLISTRVHIEKNVLNYVDEIKGTLTADSLSRQGFSNEHVDMITSFIDSMYERLKVEGDLNIYLVLTHGDFCPANMLNTTQGLRVIDWESATDRSALFDYYSYFFYRSLHQELPLATTASELTITLPSVLSELALIAPEISENVRAHENEYRWIFYLERIAMLVDREKHDTKLDIMGNIFRYIEFFNCYEEQCSKTTQRRTVKRENLKTVSAKAGGYE